MWCLSCLLTSQIPHDKWLDLLLQLAFPKGHPSRSAGSLLRLQLREQGSPKAHVPRVPTTPLPHHAENLLGKRLRERPLLRNCSGPCSSLSSICQNSCNKSEDFPSTALPLPDHSAPLVLLSLVPNYFPPVCFSVAFALKLAPLLSGMRQQCSLRALVPTSPITACVFARLRVGNAGGGRSCAHRDRSLAPSKHFQEQ